TVIFHRTVHAVGQMDTSVPDPPLEIAAPPRDTAGARVIIAAEDAKPNSALVPIVTSLRMAPVVVPTGTNVQTLVLETAVLQMATVEAQAIIAMQAVNLHLALVPAATFLLMAHVVGPMGTNAPTPVLGIVA